MSDLATLEIRIQSLEVASATQRLDRLVVASDKAEKATDSFTSSTAALDRVATRLDNQLIRLARNIGIVAAAYASISTVRSVVETTAAIEKGLVGIAKTANLTDEELAQVERRFKSLSATLSTPIE